ncbi:NAD-dependent epimerase/dehydratase family protein [Geodermatophilus sp. DSM 44513]|uniref:NAD-dependent epimerase/dehydratase family protein n=1 Tax=Geodermatophilus sp. DSM 44513 TaxID=1528104 RepID=UPI0012839A24|nr:NAD-dependent epimerase/dehydratase family protein [Geodermatophilus sp. DSM 44513]WNV76503.1 NAD-dependent epimerase/dehydratase family protein [Geodermatophilus sp. DSM 44513]
MSWLVTGGAGYVGAHVVRAMAAAGERVVVLDDLSTGDPARLVAVPLVVGSVRDRGLVRRVLREHAVQGVVHLAGRAGAEESGADPLPYWTENVEGTVALLEGCRAKGVARVVLSSTAAAYPEADGTPRSPYGRTALAAEWAVRDGAAWGCAAVVLRCCEVAGAATPELGDRSPTGPLAPVFRAVDEGRRPVLHGDGHPTPDGSPVRDLVHVADVADAHLAAVRALTAGSPGGTHDVGRGEPSSDREVLRLVGEVTGADTEPEVVAARPGAPGRLAAADRTARELGFRARRDLRSVVASAWAAWRAQQPF